MISALRIIDIKAKAMPLDLAGDTPAARYVRSLGVPVDAPLVPHSFYAHPNLDHWATPPGTTRERKFPALIALTWRGEAFYSLHACFLTEEGKLAPLTYQHLRLGILDGTCVEISNGGDPDELWISRSVETGLRATFTQGARRNVVAALLASQIPELDVLARLPRPRRIMVACDGLDETPRKIEERARAISALRERNFDAHLEIVRPALEEIGLR